jgi:putative ABC transport system permease protein
VLSYWGIDLLRAVKPANLPRVDEVSLQPWVLVFTASISVACGLLFGILPALHASKANINDLLKETANRGSTARAGRARGLLVATEFATALVLLVGAGLTIKSFVHLTAVNLGFVPENLLTFQLSLPPEKYGPESGLNALDRYLEAMASIPGVESAAYSNSPPLVNTVTQSFHRVQDDMKDISTLQEAVMNITNAHYLDTLKISLLRGRFLNDRDRANTAKVVVVDENLAKGVFPGKDPIGQQIKYGENEHPVVLEIVGVVAHVKQFGLDEANPVNMQFYVPISQIPSDYLGDVLRQVSFVVRGSSGAALLSQSVRAALSQIDSSQPLYELKTYKEVVKSQTELQRFTAMLLASFAGIALFLAALGIYGVLSYGVEQRVHEIGIRMALGATTSDVLRVLVGTAMLTVLVGLGAGSLVALALTRYMRSVLYGVRASDPLVFGGIAGLLTVVALLASLAPARRATKIHPMVALRSD